MNGFFFMKYCCIIFCWYLKKKKDDPYKNVLRVCEKVNEQTTSSK
jgi:hypothetical protein